MESTTVQFYQIPLSYGISMEILPHRTLMSEHNLPPTFLVYHEEQDHAVGQRTAQQPQESSHHTRPERERDKKRDKEMCNKK